MTFQERLNGRIIVCPDFFDSWGVLDVDKLTKFIKEKSLRFSPSAFLISMEDEEVSFEIRKQKVKILRDYFSSEEIPFIVNVSASSIKDSLALAFWLHKKSLCKGICYTVAPKCWEKNLDLIIQNLNNFIDFSLILRIKSDDNGNYPSLKTLSDIYKQHINIIAIKSDFTFDTLFTPNRFLPVRIFFNGKEKGIWENERMQDNVQLAS